MIDRGSTGRFGSEYAVHETVVVVVVAAAALIIVVARRRRQELFAKLQIRAAFS